MQELQDMIVESYDLRDDEDDSDLQDRLKSPTPATPPVYEEQSLPDCKVCHDLPTGIENIQLILELTDLQEIIHDIMLELRILRPLSNGPSMISTLWQENRKDTSQEIMSPFKVDAIPVFDVESKKTSLKHEEPVGLTSNEPLAGTMSVQQYYQSSCRQTQIYVPIERFAEACLYSYLVRVFTDKGEERSAGQLILIYLIGTTGTVPTLSNMLLESVIGSHIDKKSLSRLVNDAIDLLPYTKVSLAANFCDQEAIVRELEDLF